jgi:glycosidase
MTSKFHTCVRFASSASAVPLTSARLSRILAATARAACASLLISFSLGACGGGGGGGGSDSVVPPVVVPPVLQAVDTSSVPQTVTGSALQASWRDGVFMEIFVRAYQDSNGDGIGDLRGLTQRLDYLKSLGVTGLWLMPVNPSQDGDHGYAVKDYRAIAPEYGTMADFDELLKQAHQRGIGIIIDYVINHSAAQHPAFVNAAGSSSNAFRDWYIWQDFSPSGWSIYGGNPWRNSTFGSYFAGFSVTMPDFNLKNNGVLAWHQDNLRFWLNRGVDGFRFDAVGNLVENGPAAWENQPENHVVMAGVQATLSPYSNRFMVCEAPAAPLRFAQPDSCGSSFAFGYQSDLVRAAQGSVADIARIATYWSTAPAGMVGFASNHDSFAGQRLFDQLGGDQKRMQLAAATYLLQTRSPFIYYGEELGMAGAASLSGDAKLRTPMSWTNDSVRTGFTTGQPFRALSSNLANANVALQDGDPSSLLNFYRSIIALRQSLPSLQRGAYQAASSSGALMSFQRVLGVERTLVAFNYGASGGVLQARGLASGAKLRRLWPTGGGDLLADAGGSVDVALPGQSVAVFAVVP